MGSSNADTVWGITAGFDNNFWARTGVTTSYVQRHDGDSLPDPECYNDPLELLSLAQTQLTACIDEQASPVLFEIYTRAMLGERKRMSRC